MFAMGMSPEDRAEYEAEVEKQKQAILAKRQDDQNRLEEFLSEAPVEHLILVRRILHTCIATEDFRQVAYLEGEITGVLRYVRKVCPSCGTDHTEDAISEILAHADDVDEANNLDLGGHS